MTGTEKACVEKGKCKVQAGEGGKQENMESGSIRKIESVKDNMKRVKTLPSPSFCPPSSPPTPMALSPLDTGPACKKLAGRQQQRLFLRHRAGQTDYALSISVEVL